jgi:hypothetical protein
MSHRKCSILWHVHINDTLQVIDIIVHQRKETFLCIRVEGHGKRWRAMHLEWGIKLCKIWLRTVPIEWALLFICILVSWNYSKTNSSWCTWMRSDLTWDLSKLSIAGFPLQYYYTYTFDVTHPCISHTQNEGWSLTNCVWFQIWSNLRYRCMYDWEIVNSYRQHVFGIGTS